MSLWMVIWVGTVDRGTGTGTEEWCRMKEGFEQFQDLQSVNLDMDVTAPTTVEEMVGSLTDDAEGEAEHRLCQQDDRTSSCGRGANRQTDRRGE